jgi:hypothetical protein
LHSGTALLFVCGFSALRAEKSHTKDIGKYLAAAGKKNGIAMREGATA